MIKVGDKVILRKAPFDPHEVGLSEGHLEDLINYIENNRYLVVRMLDKNNIWFRQSDCYWRTSWFVPYNKQLELDFGEENDGPKTH